MPLPTVLEERRIWLQAILERLAEAAPTETGKIGTFIDLAPLGVDPAAAGYVTALTDFLRALGAVTLDATGTRLEVPSVQAGYVLRLLHALLEHNAPLVADWPHEGVTPVAAHPFGTGVDLLAALERRRQDIAPDAGPLRAVNVAIGLIARRLPADERAYLLHWDAPAQRWQLVGGRFEHRDGTLRATMLRELVEELESPPLAEGVHVQLTELGPPFIEVRPSPTFGLLTRTTFQAYAVRFLTTMPPLHAELRWASERELLAGATTDGQPIAAGPFRRIRAQSGPELEALVG